MRSTRLLPAYGPALSLGCADDTPAAVDSEERAKLPGLLGNWIYSANFLAPSALPRADTMQCVVLAARLEIPGPAVVDGNTKTWPHWADGTVVSGTLNCDSPQGPAFSISMADRTLVSWRGIDSAGVTIGVASPVGLIYINCSSCLCAPRATEAIGPSLSSTVGGGTFTATRVE